MKPTTASPIIGYHGTTAGNFQEFVPRIRKGEQLGFGIHFSADPLFAKLYALDVLTARKGRSPILYVAELSLSNPLTSNKIVTEGTKEFDLAKNLAGRRFWTSKDEEGRQCAWLQHAIDASSPTRAIKLISEAGYDGVIYEARVGTQGVNARIIAKSLSYLLMSNEQIKIISSIDLLANPLKGSTPAHQDKDLVARIKTITKAHKAEKSIELEVLAPRKSKNISHKP
jgi:hypothetical protein